jgi:hypothetical protein
VGARKWQKPFGVGRQMSHPVCYNRLMIIETDMKDKLFKVTTRDEVTHVKAFDLGHAERIAARLFGDCQVETVTERFERFKEFNR